jgi:hypothetical protein
VAVVVELILAQQSLHLLRSDFYHRVVGTWRSIALD